METRMVISAQWIVGFVDGEGCFHVALNRNGKMAQGIQCLPEFTVTQHSRDLPILHALKREFGCGVVRVNRGKIHCYRVRAQENLLEKILPFFEKHKLKSKKRVDFERFRHVLHMMSRGEHLTKKGLEKIRAISQMMNRKASQGNPNPIITQDRVQPALKGVGETERNSLTTNYSPA